MQIKGRKLSSMENPFEILRARNVMHKTRESVLFKDSTLSWCEKECVNNRFNIEDII